MAIEFEDTGLVMDEVRERSAEAIEEVGKFAYELIGSVLLENLHDYFTGYTTEALDNLVEEGILLASPHTPHTWYRVTTEEERKAYADAGGS